MFGGGVRVFGGAREGGGGSRRRIRRRVRDTARHAPLALQLLEPPPDTRPNVTDQEGFETAAVGWYQSCMAEDGTGTGAGW